MSQLGQKAKYSLRAHIVCFSSDSGLKSGQLSNVMLGGTNRTVEVGQSMSALPGISDIYLFRYCQGIIRLDTEISNGAFDLGVAKQKLDSP